MNCLEFHSYFEQRRRDEVPKDHPAELAEHVAVCGECSRWLASQNRLRTSLDLLRQSAPTVSAALDAGVIASYRKRMAEREATGSISITETMFPAWLRLGLAFAAVLLIAATIFTLRKPSMTSDNKPQVQLPVQGTAPVAEAEAPVSSHKKSVAITKTHARRHEVTADQIATATPSITRGNSLPDGFRSLMYCDEIICDGGMEVVRVQFSPMGLSTGSAFANRVVYADVLVGADGFARGIRIER